MKDINVLYISFSFPPVNAAASFRATKLTNRLHGRGIRPTILTKTIDRESHIHRSTQMSLLQDVSKKTSIKRARFFSPTLFHVPLKILSFIRRIMSFGHGDKTSEISFTLVGGIPKDPFIPDHYIEWLPLAFLKVMKLKERKNFDLIYATGPPFTVHVLGYLLKALLKKPLVVEYRDPWTDDPYQKKIRLKERVNAFIEGLILHRADAVVCIAEPLKENLIRKYNLGALSSKFIVIPSAFDPVDFEKCVQVESDGGNILKAVITTTLYGGRKPDLLFKAIGRLKKGGYLAGIDFIIEIFGYNDPEKFQELLELHDVLDMVKFKGLIPHDECLAMMVGSTINLDVGEAEFDYPTLTYHFWEYIGSGKRVFYFGNSKSYRARFIEQNDLGVVLPADDEEILFEKLKDIIEQFKHKTLVSTLPAGKVSEHTWNSRVNSLARLIRSVIKSVRRSKKQGEV
ncbi:MAG: glycosyltransferase [Promethearchaeota archaeon]